MKLRILIAALALGLTMPAAAQFTTKVNAYEVELSTVRLPQADSGTMAFRACPGCDFQTTRVSSATRWRLNGKAMTLRKLRESLARMKDRDDADVTVLHHLGLDQITEVSIYIR